MADSFSETSSKSWLGCIMDSIKNVLIGLLLFVASFVVLFWNEGRAVITARSLAEGAKNVISVEAAAVQPENEGKLIHFSGRAATTDTLQDTLFQVSANALKLNRKVEMYQWVEDKKTETRKRTGGSEETTTTYSYAMRWSENWNDSTKFKESTSHANPPMNTASETMTASPITVGAFALTRGLVSKINASETLNLSDNDPVTVGDGFKKTGNGYYRGANQDSPALGDLRVSFSAVNPQDVSVVAQQIGSTLQPYQTKAGRALEMLEPGTVAAAQMFQEAAASNARQTWLLRLVGFLAMWFGLMMVVNPLKVMADIVPFFGHFVGGGLALATLCVALPMSLLTIGVAWFFFRPLLSLGLLAGAIGVMFVIVTLLKKRQAQRAKPVLA